MLNDDQQALSFEQFAHFLRDVRQISSKELITTETQFERDLGVTGDDGIDLMRATERQFGVELASKEDGCRRTFGLAPNEYLFHGEGIDILGLFKSTSVRAFTVGELYEAVQRKLSEERKQG